MSESQICIHYLSVGWVYLLVGWIYLLMEWVYLLIGWAYLPIGEMFTCWDEFIRWWDEFTCFWNEFTCWFDELTRWWSEFTAWWGVVLYFSIRASQLGNSRLFLQDSLTPALRPFSHNHATHSTLYQDYQPYFLDGRLVVFTILQYCSCHSDRSFVAIFSDHDAAECSLQTMKKHFKNKTSLWTMFLVCLSFKCRQNINL